MVSGKKNICNWNLKFKDKIGLKVNVKIKKIKKMDKFWGLQICPSSVEVTSKVSVYTNETK